MMQAQSTGQSVRVQTLPLGYRKEYEDKEYQISVNKPQFPSCEIKIIVSTHHVTHTECAHVSGGR